MGGESQARIYENQDASVVATTLARQWWVSNGRPSPPTMAPVSLANAANAKLLGNHWFAKGALRAVDENIHRRAPLLAAVSLLLNGGTSSIGRRENELSDGVRKYGGQIQILGSEALARRFVFDVFGKAKARPRFSALGQRMLLMCTWCGRSH